MIYYFRLPFCCFCVSDCSGILFCA